MIMLCSNKTDEIEKITSKSKNSNLQNTIFSYNFQRYVANVFFLH